MKKSICILSTIFLCCIFSTASFAQWSQQMQEDDTISAHTGLQYNHAMVSDGNGGAILTWQDNRNSNYDIFAQRIDSKGRLKWGSSDLVISATSDDQQLPIAVSDGNNGAFVSWNDYTDHHYWIQHVDSSGNLLCGSNGKQVPFYTNSNAIYNMTMCSDGKKGCIIAGEYNQIWNWSHIMVNRFNATGDTLWSIGVKLDGASESRAPQIVSDGNGGAIVVWWTFEGGGSTFYSEHVDSSGNISWPTAVKLSGVTLNNYPPYQLISDNNHGAILVWQFWNLGADNILAQHIDTAGIISMGSDGTVICDAAYQQISPRVTRTSNDKFICAWSDFRDDASWQVYAQKFDTTGNVKWTNNGVQLSSQWTYIPTPMITADLDKGAYVSWIASENLVSSVYSQHLGGDGTPAWSDPVQVSSNAHTPFYPHDQVITNDSSAIYSFETYSGASTSDVYVKKVTPSGGYGCALAQPTITADGNDLISSLEATYQWYKDGALIPGATSQTYSPSQNGSYTVEVSDGYGCSEISEPFNFVATTIGTVNELSLSIYPNPCDGYFILNTGNDFPLSSIAVNDAVGRTFFSEALVGSERSIRIDISGLASGVYFITAKSGDQILQSKIVKR